MNHRIRELARLAKDYAYDNEDPDERTSWDFLFETKFAELIVRECALVAGIMEHEGRGGIGGQILDSFGVDYESIN